MNLTNGNMKTDIATAICAIAAAVAPIAAVVRHRALEVVVVIAMTRRSARHKADNATPASQLARITIKVAVALFQHLRLAAGIVVVIARTRHIARRKAVNATAASHQARTIIIVAAVVQHLRLAAVALVLVVKDWASLQNLMVHASLSGTIRS